MNPNMNINFATEMKVDGSDSRDIVTQYKEILEALAIEAGKDAGGDREDKDLAPVDRDCLLNGTREGREECWTDVKKVRLETVNFFPLRNEKTKEADVYRTGGSLTDIFHRSTAFTFREQNKYLMVLLNAELLTVKDQIDKENSHSKPVSWSEEFAKLLQWISTSLKGEGIIIMLADGRSRAIRRKFEDFVDLHFSDVSRHAEVWITYGGEAPDDVRGKGRKIAFSANTKESCFACFTFSKLKMKAKDRSQYAGSGETSTHNVTYSGVDSRSFKSLPKLPLVDKEKIIGGKVGRFPEDVAEELEDGHPLFWQEYKSCLFYAALYTDFDIGWVFDLAAGSGCAAAAALLSGVGYEGIATNESHRDWLGQLLDRYCLAFLAEDSSCKKSLQDDINKYFSNTVTKAKIVFDNSNVSEDDAEDPDKNDDDQAS